MTILVTGDNGNIGSRLVETLRAQGYSVRATARDISTLSPGHGVDTVHMDLTNPSAPDFVPALDGVQTVFLYPALSSMDGFLQAVWSTNRSNKALPARASHIPSYTRVGWLPMHYATGVRRSAAAGPYRPPIRTPA
ncbi:MAG TPA: NAD-dependent epimerase/dehydratase family protein [Mycobacterium sp.]